MRLILIIIIAGIAGTLLFFVIKSGFIDSDVAFPDLTYEDIKNSSHPTLAEYDSLIISNYENSLSITGLQDFSLDVEQGDYIESFIDVVEGLIRLLPQSIEAKVGRHYTDDTGDYWIVEVEIEDQIYKFRTDAIGGAYMDTEAVFNTLNDILTDYAPDYNVIYPQISSGQALSVVIANEVMLSQAIEEGFPLFRDSIKWKGSKPEYEIILSNVYSMDEEELNKVFVMEYNTLLGERNNRIELNQKNFRIIDVQGNGQIYIKVHDKVIGTPRKRNQMIYCRDQISEYLFAYVLSKQNPKVTLHKIDIKANRSEPLDEGDLMATLKQGLFEGKDE